MLLHKDKNLFEQTIFQVAQRSGIESGIIEKDYYVSLLLKELSQTLPSMIFKGGTSLQALKTNSESTIDEIVTNISVSRETIKRSLKTLSEKVLIKRVGSDKTGHWEIIE